MESFPQPNENFPSPEQKPEKEIITRDKVLIAFRNLLEKGIKNPENHSNPDMAQAQELLDTWIEQETEIAEAGTNKQSLEWALSHATIFIDAGFVDPKINREMLGERNEWLKQDYDSAIREELEKLAQDILERIHQINDILGEERFDPANTETEQIRPIVEPGFNQFELKVNELKKIGGALLEHPDDPEANRELRNILKNERFVTSLTNHLQSRGYADNKNNRLYTFIKFTDEVTFCGESDSSSFIFDKTEIINTSEARQRLSQMEADKNLKRELA